jgi:hypothetical protein
MTFGNPLFGVAEDTRGGQQSQSLNREGLRRKLGASLSSARIAALLREHWLLVVILFVGAAVRLYDFGSVPAGFNQD